MPYLDDHTALFRNELRRIISEQRFNLSLSAYAREAAEDAAMFKRLVLSLEARVAAEPAEERFVAEPHAIVETVCGSAAEIDMSDEGDRAHVDKAAKDYHANGKIVRDDKDILSTAGRGKNVHPLHADRELVNKGRDVHEVERCAVGMPSPTSLPCYGTLVDTSTSPSERSEGGVAAGQFTTRSVSVGGQHFRSQKGARGKNAIITSGAPLVILRPWNRLTRAERFSEVIRHAATADGRAVTLNLSLGRQIGTSESDDPMRNISKRINEAMNKYGLAGMPLALRLEVTPDTGRLHLHGVVIPEYHDVAIIKKALRDGAGLITGRSGSTQVKLKRITDAKGWAGYLSKDARRTSKAVEHDRLTWISHSLTRAARDRYEEVRRGQKPANRNGCSSGVITAGFAACA